MKPEFIRVIRCKTADILEQVERGLRAKGLVKTNQYLTYKIGDDCIDFEIHQNEEQKPPKEI